MVQSQPAALRGFIGHFRQQDVQVDALGSSLATLQAAFEFVRDQVAFEPYAGIMKGASGTLATRGGNALDRALLLAALLAQQGIDVSLARGTLADDQAARVIDAIFTRPDPITLMAKSLPTAINGPIDRASRTKILDRALTRTSLHKQEGDATLAALQASIAASGLVVPLRTTPLAAVRDHYWLQAISGGSRIDLDPTLPTAKAGQAIAESSATFELNHLPDEWFHRITIRIVADVLEQGVISTEEVLRSRAKSADLIDQPVRVVIGPKALERKQNDFLAAVVMGKSSVARSFQLSRTSSAASGTGGLLGGLEGADSHEDARLGRLAIEVISSAPGSADVKSRRVIADRLDRQGGVNRIEPGMLDDDGLRLLLLQAWEGAIDVGPVHPLQLLNARLTSSDAHQPMMERALAATLNDGPFTIDSLASPQLSPTVLGFFYFSALSHWSTAREHAPEVRTHHARPRVAFLRNGLVVHDWSAPATSRRLQQSLDVLNQPYGFTGPSAGAGRLALRFGLTDATLERALTRSGADYSTVALFRAAAGEGTRTVTLDKRRFEQIDALGLPFAIRHVLRDEVEQGRILTMPVSLVSLGDIRTFGWWSLDPDSGVPLGQMELGAGQGAVETSQLTEKMIEMTHIIIKFYGGLLGCFYVEAADQLVPPAGPYTVNGMWLTPKIKGGRPLAECVAEKTCEAILEYTMLAATSVHYHFKEWATSAALDLGEMVIKMLIAEGAAELSCHQLTNPH